MPAPAARRPPARKRDQRRPLPSPNVDQIEAYDFSPRGGRPPITYTTDQMLSICAEVADGATLRTICARPGMPTAATFRTWIAKNPTLREIWLLAKTERAHAYFDEAVDLARRLSAGSWDKEDTNRVRALQIAIDTMRIAAARLDPREYGEKQPDRVVVPVQINTTLNLDPSRPATDAASLYSIEAKVEVPFALPQNES